MTEFVKAIPAAASHPLALAAYAIAAVLFLFAGARLRELKSILKKLEAVPPAHRKEVIEIASRTKLPDRITAEQWIRLRRLQYTWLTVAALLVAAITIAAIAIVRPSTPSRDVVPSGIFRSPNLGLQFRQTESPIVFNLSGGSTVAITLERKPFQLLVPREGPPLVRVTVWTSASIFAGLPETSETFDQPLYFLPGTGMAEWKYGEPRLFLNPEGHNYLNATRLEAISQEFFAKSIAYFDQPENELKRIGLEEITSPLHFVVWRDLNNNHQCEWGEFERIIVTFK